MGRGQSPDHAKTNRIPRFGHFEHLRLLTPLQVALCAEGRDERRDVRIAHAKVASGVGNELPARALLPARSARQTLQRRLQASIPRVGSFWPGASMHAMCMYMHMRTVRSLIAASYALTGRPAPYASWSCGDVSWGA